VIATNWRPSGRRDQKWRNSESVSIVPPDFVETRNSVRSRSTRSATVRIAPASVESSTCSDGQPSCAPKLWRITSGASDEPPMPSSTTSWKPSSRISRAKASRSSTASSIVSTIVSHPSRLATSACPAGPQSVSSFFQMRCATSSTIARRTRSAIRGSSSSGICAWMVGGREVTIASRF
jgi:hypothetical protein